MPDRMNLQVLDELPVVDLWERIDDVEIDDVEIDGDAPERVTVGTLSRERSDRPYMLAVAALLVVAGAVGVATLALRRGSVGDALEAGGSTSVVSAPPVATDAGPTVADEPTGFVWFDVAEVLLTVDRSKSRWWRVDPDDVSGDQSGAVSAVYGMSEVSAEARTLTDLVRVTWYPATVDRPGLPTGESLYADSDVQAVHLVTERGSEIWADVSTGQVISRIAIVTAASSDWTPTIADLRTLANAGRSDPPPTLAGRAQLVVDADVPLWPAAGSVMAGTTADNRAVTVRTWLDSPSPLVFAFEFGAERVRVDGGLDPTWWIESGSGAVALVELPTAGGGEAQTAVIAGLERRDAVGLARALRPVAQSTWSDAFGDARPIADERVPAESAEVAPLLPDALPVGAQPVLAEILEINPSARGVWTSREVGVFDDDVLVAAATGFRSELVGDSEAAIYGDRLVLPTGRPHIASDNEWTGLNVLLLDSVDWNGSATFLMTTTPAGSDWAPDVIASVDALGSLPRAEDFAGYPGAEEVSERTLRAGRSYSIATWSLPDSDVGLAIQTFPGNHAPSLPLVGATGGARRTILAGDRTLWTAESADRSMVIDEGPDFSVVLSADLPLDELLAIHASLRPVSDEQFRALAHP